MKNILVPTDFSKQATWALEAAAGIAKKSGAQITLLHVVEAATGASFNTVGEVGYDLMEEKVFTLKLVQKSKSLLAKAANDKMLEGLKVETALQVGSPYHGIASIISDNKVDLTVMGTSGRTKLERMLMGSITEKVLRHAQSPVLTIHEKPSTTDFKNIVYATSMHDDEAVFSRIMRTTQQLYGSTIHLVHINRPVHFQRSTTVKAALERFAKKVRLQNFTINIFDDFSTEEGIIYFSESIKADLIGMAALGHSGFSHVLTGSIAQNISNHAHRPVLTYLLNHKKN